MLWIFGSSWGRYWFICSPLFLCCDYHILQLLVIFVFDFLSILINFILVWFSFKDLLLNEQVVMSSDLVMSVGLETVLSIFFIKTITLLHFFHDLLMCSNYINTDPDPCRDRYNGLVDLEPLVRFYLLQTIPYVRVRDQDMKDQVSHIFW